MRPQAAANLSQGHQGQLGPHMLSPKTPTGAATNLTTPLLDISRIQQTTSSPLLFQQTPHCQSRFKPQIAHHSAQGNGHLANGHAIHAISDGHISGLGPAHVHQSGQVDPHELPTTSYTTITDSMEGIHEMLASLALMCLLSLLMAFLALFFLQRTGPIIALPTDEAASGAHNPTVQIEPATSSSTATYSFLQSNSLVKAPSSQQHSPFTSQQRMSSGQGSTFGTASSSSRTSGPNSVNGASRIVANTREYVRVFQISVSLSTLTITLNLTCLFISCIQFLSAVKLLKTPQGKKR